ncbi:MAG TPA: o-succinylbenzoate synthase, partial [Ktedonobacteraceae bacterium]|nr:o-succinylbenzoate synthase [Ktedonobacteraceae bacterium]
APAPAICGVETALLDALGKTTGQAVSAILAGDGAEPRSGVMVNAVVGAKAIDGAVEEANAAIASGFRCVKLKVGWEQDVAREIERIAAVREAIGTGVHLRLDANEGWNRAQAMTVLAACARFDIQYVEQPVKAGDLEGMRWLRRAALVPIAADESLAHLESAYRILDSADILIIKPQLIGGLRASAQLIIDAAALGIGSVVTSSIEAGIGLVAALHLAAAMPQISLECGLATLHLLEDDLLVDELPIRDGFLAVPGGAGLGVRLDRDALERYQAQ